MTFRLAAGLIVLCALVMSAAVVYARLGDTEAASGRISAAAEIATPGPEEPTPVPYPDFINALGIDVQPDAANTATSYGAVESCVSVEQGETFRVDIVVDVDAEPPYVAGVQFLLSYDPDVVSIVGVDSQLWLVSEGVSGFVDFSDGVPDTDGQFWVVAASIGSSEGVSGRGVLTQLDFEAVAEGETGLAVGMLDLVGPTGSELTNPALAGGIASVIVGASVLAAFRRSRGRRRRI